MRPEEELEHLRYMLRHIMRCATEASDGELIGMVRFQRDARHQAEARVRALENRLRRYGVPLDGPLPPARDSADA